MMYLKSSVPSSLAPSHDTRRAFVISYRPSSPFWKTTPPVPPLPINRYDPWVKRRLMSPPPDNLPGRANSFRKRDFPSRFSNLHLPLLCKSPCWFRNLRPIRSGQRKGLFPPLRARMIVPSAPFEASFFPLGHRLHSDIRELRPMSLWRCLLALRVTPSPRFHPPAPLISAMPYGSPIEAVLSTPLFLSPSAQLCLSPPQTLFCTTHFPPFRLFYV